ncbi:MAG TPA: DUF697 domain-containing protein, partial [Myxococcota bacterium]|nr:DUF697 domain-containing protein [Myxococcota bacterium]
MTLPESISVPPPPDAVVVENLLLRHGIMAAGAGLIGIPVVDLAAITVINLRLLRELAILYGVPYQAEPARQAFVGLISGLGGQLLIAGPVYGLLRMVPVVGWVLGGVSVAGVAGGLTYATGRVLSLHFKKGGNFQNFSASAVQDLFRKEAAAGAEKVRAAAVGAEAVDVEVLPLESPPDSTEPAPNSVDAEPLLPAPPPPPP